MGFEILEDTWVIDVMEADRPFRTGAYVVLGDGLTLVDPGSTRGVPFLLDGLRGLGLKLQDIRRIIVTHVHLDHAGGVGTLMRNLPRATVFCHPRAARHLVDPTRLQAGAQAVYGDRFDSLWGELVPVPSWQVKPQEDLAVVEVGSHAFRFFDSPGHARHHATILDERTGGLFTGDAVGIRYDPKNTGWPFTYGLPTTSPSDFDPIVMLKTMDRLQHLGATSILHTHFAASVPDDAWGFSRKGLEGMLAIFDRIGGRARSYRDFQRAWEDWVQEDLAKKGHTSLDFSALEEDFRLNALGMWGYWQKRQAENAEPSSPNRPI